jgi:glycine cleavage system transcriptional repressor
MAKYLVMTAVGMDRPGLVAGITEALLEGGCNVEDSSMTRLGGDFAMILLVRHAEGSSESLRKALDAAGRALNLTVSVRDIPESEIRDSEETGEAFHISVYGADRAGIVHAIARALAGRGASITDLRTTVAGTDDKPIYVMQIEALAPEAEAAGLPAAVTEAAGALGVDVAVRRIESAAL